MFMDGLLYVIISAVLHINGYNARAIGVDFSEQTMVRSSELTAGRPHSSSDHLVPSSQFVGTGQ